MLRLIYKAFRKIINEDYAVIIKEKLNASLTASKLGNLSNTSYFLTESTTKLELIKPYFEEKEKERIAIKIKDIKGIVATLDRMFFDRTYTKLIESDQNMLNSTIFDIIAIISKKYP